MGETDIHQDDRNDWDLWSEKESSEQWYALECIGSLQETGALGPAPGVADEGSDEDAYGIEDFLGGSFTRLDLQIPVPPPSTNAKSQAPYDVMPQESDPTSQGSEEKKKLHKIPERPAEPKPGPPKAPGIVRKTSQESDSGKKTEDDPSQGSKQTMPEKRVAPVKVPSQEAIIAQTLENTVWLQEGSQVLGFGNYQSYTYREAWNWICSGAVNLSGIFQGYSMVGEKMLNFMNWMYRLQQAMEMRREAA